MVVAVVKLVNSLCIVVVAVAKRVVERVAAVATEVVVAVEARAVEARAVEAREVVAARVVVVAKVVVVAVEKRALEQNMFGCACVSHLGFTMAFVSGYTQNLCEL